MSEIATYHITDGELRHYGVRGMKWGVRRNLKRLGNANSAKDSDARAKAVAKLEKHKAKSIKKLDKLQSKQPDLQKRVDKANTNLAEKRAGALQKAARYSRKASRKWTFNREGKMRKAMKWQAKAMSYESAAADAKAKLEKNRQMQETFKKGISQIDKALVDKGRKYLNQ